MEIKVGLLPGQSVKKKRVIDFPDYRMTNDEILNSGEFITIKVDENKASPEDLPSIGDNAAHQLLDKIKDWKFKFPKPQCATICETLKQKSRCITPGCCDVEAFGEAIAEDLKFYLKSYFKLREFDEGAFI